MRTEGLEPTRLATLDPKSSASTNFATSAGMFGFFLVLRKIKNLTLKKNQVLNDYAAASTTSIKVLFL